LNTIHAPENRNADFSTSGFEVSFWHYLAIIAQLIAPQRQ